MSGGWHFLGIFGSILLFGICLLGCQPAVSPAPELWPALRCEEAGKVEHGRLEETSRGYAYSFAVYLPPCYDQEQELAYPVLYLIPGLGSGPSSWFSAGANEAADEMILSGKVPPFLIVATETITADPLGELINTELIPFIEEHYRVRPGRSYQSVAGASLGSMGAYRLAFQHPNQFASAGMFGGGLISGEEPRVEAWLDAIAADSRPRVFLNTGEQDPLMLERAEAMMDMLDEKQIEHAQVFSPGEHTYAYWVSNLQTYFEWLAKDWE